MCDLLNNLEKSDFMLCNNSAYLQYKDRYQNDSIFIQQMSNPQQWCLKNIDEDSKFKIQANPRISTITPLIKKRGSTHPEPIKPCPKLYTKYNMRDFLLIPCPINTYKNYQVFDDNKQCSKSHQVLNNWTKRKIITGSD